MNSHTTVLLLINFGLELSCVLINPGERTQVGNLPARPFPYFCLKFFSLQLESRSDTSKISPNLPEHKKEN